MKRKITGVLTLAALSITLLAGCNSADNSITITVWDDETNREVVEELCNDFIAEYNAQYPNGVEIKIEFQSQTEAQAVETLVTVASTGEGPDVVAFTHDTLATAVRSDLFDPTPYAEELKATMSEESIDAVTYEGTIYGYPITAESITVIYDKRQINASELTSFDTLLASSKKIGWNVSGDGSSYYMFGLATDSILFGEDGTDSTNVDIATEQTVANFTKFINEYTGCIESMTPETAVSLINYGTIAGVISSPFLYSQVAAAIGVENTGLALLPSINGVQQRPFSGYKAYAVNRYTEYPTIAHSLALYLTNAESQMYRLYKNQYLPTTTSADIEEYIANNEIMQVFQSSLNNSILMPNIDAMANFWAPMTTACTSLWNSRNNGVTLESVKALFEDVTTTILNG